MKAATYARYGSPDVIKIEQVAKPSLKATEVLVKVKASSVTTADTMMRRGDPFFARFATGFPKPKVSIMGTGFSGEVVALGSDVTDYQVGQSVFGETAMGFSANAEFLCIDARKEKALLAPLPLGMRHVEAAPLGDGALTAFNFLQSVTQLKAGQHLLVNGASGSIGTAAIQIGKALGATVTAVCSEKNHDLVKSLGADAVIDYHKTDFAHHTNTYDVIFDTVGARRFNDCQASLTRYGEYLSPVLTFPLLWQMLWTSKFSKKKAKFAATGLKSPAELSLHMQTIIELMNAGKLKTVIDREYALDDIRAAHEYVETGHKCGSVVVLA